MITRQEYNKALDIVEAYHQQLFIESINSNLRNTDKTLLKDWDKLIQCSTRLYNVLNGNYHKGDVPIRYIEDLDEKEFMRLRYSGKVTWNEFTKLRGY